MSSITYSAELRPDAVLRRIVLLSGSIFGVAGVVLILTLPLPAAALISGSGAWLVSCVWELVKTRRGYVLCRRLRVSANGDILQLDPDGVWHAARLLSGSVLLSRIGWIRLENTRGQKYAELVRGECRESDDWRRLQVIWRHIGATPRSC